MPEKDVIKTKRKLLVIDDDNTLRQFLESILLEDGYEVLIAREGREGFDLACSELPDLILLDVNMPKMDGWEVCDRLRKNGSTKQIPIVFLTARDNQEEIKMAMRLGSNKYLNKPFDLELLESTVVELLGQ